MPALWTPTARFVENERVVFDSGGMDSTWQHRDGHPCTVVAALKPGIDYDEEVGPMYRVVFRDGIHANVFADELTRKR